MSAWIDRATSIVVGEAEPYSVNRAARAVAQDIEHVIGQPAPVCDRSRPGDGLEIVVDSLGAHRDRLALDLPQEESFALRWLPGDRPRLLIAGGGERGAIYGLYHLAQRHLDADPWQHITGYRPKPQTRVPLDEVEFTSPAATFRFRGWHLESQGLLLPWQGDYAHQNDHWERVCETLLRCGGNMIKPETNRPESVEVGVAQRMGLLITQEHFAAFGLAPWEIVPPTPDFNWVYDDFPEAYHRLWLESMRRYPRPQRVIWTLGYRGRGDRPFWEVAPERFDTDAKRGSAITRAIHAQKALIDRQLGDQAAGFVFNAWMEGNRLLAQGDITLPPGVITVWADNGYGTFRSMIAEGCDVSQVRPILPSHDTAGTHGSYYHVSMWDYCTPVLTQFVPPQRMAQQYRQIMQCRATGYALVNAGRVCHCVTSAAAIADIWRQPERWTQVSDDEAARQFLGPWCERHFPGQQEAAQAAYHALYTLPIQYGLWGGWDDYVLGDVAFARLARNLVSMALSPTTRANYEKVPPRFFGPGPSTLAAMNRMMLQRTKEVIPRWQEARQKAQAAAESLQGPARRFFVNDLLVQIEVNLFYAVYLHEITLAVDDYVAGRFTEADQHARAAKRAVLDLASSLRQRDYRPWDRHWNHTKLLRAAGLPLAYQTAQLLTRVLDVMLTRQFAPLHAVACDDELHWLKTLDAMENLEA